MLQPTDEEWKQLCNLCEATSNCRIAASGLVAEISKEQAEICVELVVAQCTQLFGDAFTPGRAQQLVEVCTKAL